MGPTFAASQSNIAFNSNQPALPMGQLNTGIGYAADTAVDTQLQFMYLGGAPGFIDIAAPTPLEAEVASVKSVKAK